MSATKKPLELVWYGAFRDDGNGLRTFHGPDKRLTDAELAAEWHRNNADAWEANEWGNFRELGCGWPTGWSDAHDRDEVLRRFATRPHYDEEQA